MKKPSPNLDKKLEAQRQKLLILQAEVKNSEDQWAVQKKQIAEDTRVTIETSRKALVDATVEAKAQLDTLWKQIESGRQQFEALKKEQTAEIVALDQSISDLEHEQKVLSHTNATLMDDNRALESDISVRQERVDELKTTNEKLSVNIAELNVQQEQVEDKLVHCQLQLKAIKEEIQRLESHIETQTEQFNKDIAILEQRKESLTQEIVENRINDDKVRENLATWSAKLNELDKNLRIREAKVSEQEKSIVRNYNLLHT